MAKCEKRSRTERYCLARLRGMDHMTAAREAGYDAQPSGGAMRLWNIVSTLRDEPVEAQDLAMAEANLEGLLYGLDKRARKAREELTRVHTWQRALRLLDEALGAAGRL